MTVQKLKAAAAVLVLALTAGAVTYRGAGTEAAERPARAEEPLKPTAPPPRAAGSKPVEGEVPPSDATRLQGLWKVVKDEYPDGKREKWAEAARGPDFAFAFTATHATRTHRKNSTKYRLLLDADKKTIELRGEDLLGISEVLVGRYELDGDKLTICLGEDRKLPDGFTPKAPAARRYHLERMTFDLRDGDGRVIVPADEIVAYDWATHTIDLKPGSVAKLQKAYADGKKLAVPFAVAVGGEAVYRGEITAAGSSQSCRGVVIYFAAPGRKRDSVVLQLGYPAESAFEGKDPRGDETIKAALTGTGKLK